MIVNTRPRRALARRQCVCLSSVFLQCVLPCFLLFPIFFPPRSFSKVSHHFGSNVFVLFFRRKSYRRETKSLTLNANGFFGRKWAAGVSICLLSLGVWSSSSDFSCSRRRNVLVRVFAQAVCLSLVDECAPLPRPLACEPPPLRLSKPRDFLKRAHAPCRGGGGDS